MTHPIRQPRRMIYLSVPPTSSAAHWDAVRKGQLGVITTPRVGNTHVTDWPIWAADNGCFTAGDSFDLKKYIAWLDRLRPHAPRCLFATAPDVVGNADATWQRSRLVLPAIRKLGYKAALVAQNGLRDVPWDAFDVLFIGGDDSYKLGSEAAAIVAEARARGKWTHCGRVNSARRWLACRQRGYHSADGTLLARGPDKNLQRVRRWARGEQRDLFAGRDL